MAKTIKVKSFIRNGKKVKAHTRTIGGSSNSSGREIIYARAKAEAKKDKPFKKSNVKKLSEKQELASDIAARKLFDRVKNNPILNPSKSTVTPTSKGKGDLIKNGVPFRGKGPKKKNKAGSYTSEMHRDSINRLANPKRKKK